MSKPWQKSSNGSNIVNFVVVGKFDLAFMLGLILAIGIVEQPSRDICLQPKHTCSNNLDEIK
jgi:hypothetical protein